jgi:hypothetical protein
MYDKKEFDDMAKRDKNLTLYSQSNVIASYISMIKFAIEKIEFYVDEIGDDVFFDLDESIFPPDVLGDDSLFSGYTDPWSPDDDVFAARAGCDCDDCRCRNADAKINDKRMSVGNIMDMLYRLVRHPKTIGWTNATSHRHRDNRCGLA